NTLISAQSELTNVIPDGGLSKMWTHRSRLRVKSLNAERRTQSEERRKQPGRAFSILRSAFCALHSWPVRPKHERAPARPFISNHLRLSLRLQFHIPICLIQKVLPDLRIRPSLQPVQRVPFGALGVADEADVGLAEELVALAHVARQAGADDVLPGRLAAARDRDDMVERELRRRELAAAVLAAVLVAQIDIAPRELHLLPRQAVEDQQLHHMRNQDVAARRA